MSCKQPAHYKFEYFYRPKANNKVSEMKATRNETIGVDIREELEDVNKDDNENYIKSITNF